MHIYERIHETSHHLREEIPFVNHLGFTNFIRCNWKHALEGFAWIHLSENSFNRIGRENL